MAYSAKRTAASVNWPQSFSGLRPECACLKAKRLGVAVLNAVSSLALRPALKATKSPNGELGFSAPTLAVARRRPSTIGTVSFCRSCGAPPVPLSV